MAVTAAALTRSCSAATASAQSGAGAGAGRTFETAFAFTQAVHGRMFGDKPVRDALTDRGWSENGMEKSRPIVGRGILLDIAAHLGAPTLPDRYEITPEDVQGCLDRQGTELRTGDIVLFHTGHFAARYATDPAGFFASQPGMGPDAGVWLYDHGMAALGSDTSGTEVMPMRDDVKGTHVVLIVERGVHLFEMMDL